MESGLPSALFMERYDGRPTAQQVGKILPFQNHSGRAAFTGAFLTVSVGVGNAIVRYRHLTELLTQNSWWMFERNKKGSQYG